MDQNASIVIEGWRFSPTSYAVVNQCQCLEMLRRPGLDVYHIDLPFFASSWRQIRGLFPREDEDRLASIAAPPEGLVPDASIRLAHPTLVRRTNARHSWTWIVTEFGILEDSRIADGRRASEALRTPGVKFMTPSKWSFDGLVRTGADPANITVVPHGYDPATMHPPSDAERAAAREKLGWEGSFVFLNVSTLVWNKGIAGLLHAFAQVSERFPQCILAIKGSDELLQSGRRLNESLASLPPQVAHRVRARIRYLGENLTNTQIIALYQGADAYVAPYHAEGFNMPVLEAAACGLPVIVTAGGPTDDFVTDDFAMQVRAQAVEHPELAKNHGPGARALILDGQHLIELMTRAVEHPELREQARTAGPAHLARGFTWSHVVDRMLAAMVPERFASPPTPRPQGGVA